MNVLWIRKVYELPNPNSLLYSHDSDPLLMVNVVLIVAKIIRLYVSFIITVAVDDVACKLLLYLHSIFNLGIV